jgi:hypothetical protein
VNENNVRHDVSGREFCMITGRYTSAVSAPTTLLPPGIVLQLEGTQEAANQTNPEPCSVAGTEYNHGQQVSTLTLSLPTEPAECTQKGLSSYTPLFIHNFLLSLQLLISMSDVLCFLTTFPVLFYSRSPTLFFSFLSIFRVLRVLVLNLSLPRLLLSNVLI